MKVHHYVIAENKTNANIILKQFISGKIHINQIKNIYKVNFVVSENPLYNVIYRLMCTLPTYSVAVFDSSPMHPYT